MKSLKSLKKYFWLFGIFLFGIILFKSDVGRLLKYLLEIKFSYLVIAIFLAIPVFLTKSWCWNYIKKQQNIKYRLADSFFMYCSGFFIGFLTPGRIGEVAKAFYLKKDGYSWGKSLVGVIIDRLTDLIFLLFFAILGSLFYFSIFKKQVVLLFIGLAVLVAVSILIVKRDLFKWLARKILDYLVPKNFKNSWSINSEDFIRDIKNYSYRNYVIMFLITALSWFFYFLQVFFLAKSASINIPFFYLAITATVTGLITLLPISISGIGTRDAALIIFLTPFAIAKERAIILSALILFISLLEVFSGLIICWLVKPIRL